MAKPHDLLGTIPVKISEESVEPKEEKVETR